MTLSPKYILILHYLIDALIYKLLNRNEKLPSVYKETVEIVVMDVMGHALHHTSGDATGTYKFGENFIKGMYFVEVIYKNGIRTLKVIKQ